MSLEDELARLSSTAQALLERVNNLEERMENVRLRAEEAEAALVKIKESYQLRSELFTSDADCAANLAAWAEKALKKENHE